MPSAAVSDICFASFTTVTMAVVPGHTWNWPLAPLGVGTVNVIWVSLQLLTVNVAVLPGAPQLTPLSENCTYPAPRVAPNPEPFTVTTSPALALAGDTDATTAPLIAVVDVPSAKTCSPPRVAPVGSVTLASVLVGSTGSDVAK